MAKEKKQKPKKFSWKEHDKWINSFANVKTVYPKVKPNKRKRNK